MVALPREAGGTIRLSRRGAHELGTSARAARGRRRDDYAALAGCADLFERFGGHKAAAGLSLKRENLGAFRQRFEQAVLSQLDGRPLMKEDSYDAEIALEEVTIEAAQQLELLRPFGMGNPAPAFLLKEVRAESARRVGQEGQHLKLRLSQGAESRDAIGFGMGDRCEALPPKIDALVELGVNRYQGRVSPQCQLHAFLAGSQAFQTCPEAELDALVQDLAAMASNGLSGRVDAKPMAAPQGYRGSLLVCRSWQTAEAMHRLYPEYAVAVGPLADRRGGNTVLYRTPLAEALVPYERSTSATGSGTRMRRRTPPAFPWRRHPRGAGLAGRPGHAGEAAAHRG